MTLSLEVWPSKTSAVCLSYSCIHCGPTLLTGELCEQKESNHQNLCILHPLFVLLNIAKHQNVLFYMYMNRNSTSIRQAPVFRHLRALRKRPMEVYYLDEWIIITLDVAGFLHPRNILILPSQFWQIRFESCWLHCSKSWILVLLRYMYM